MDLRILSTDQTLLTDCHHLIEKTFGAAIYSQGSESMEEVVVRLAQSKKKKIATAESCTGGLTAHRITQIPGSSEIFCFGWVTYSNEAKTQELCVPSAILESEGAVSAACVEAMAHGALQKSNAHFAVALSGIAGPSGGSENKPVGTCWIAWASAEGVRSEKLILSQNRETFKQMASQHALNGLRLLLQQSD